jgi:hypothetical protein
MIKLSLFISLVFFFVYCNSYETNFKTFEFNKKEGIALAYSSIKIPKKIRGLKKIEIDSIFYKMVSDKYYLVPLDTFRYLMSGIYNPETRETPIYKALNRLKEYNIQYLIFPEITTNYHNLVNVNTEMAYSKFKGFRSRSELSISEEANYFLEANILFLDTLNEINIHQIVGSVENVPIDTMSWVFQQIVYTNIIVDLFKDFNLKLINYINK